jgi:hypothetical protein
LEVGAQAKSDSDVAEIGLSDSDVRKVESEHESYSVFADAKIIQRDERMEIQIRRPSLVLLPE